MAQLVSASGLGPEGPVFESQYPDTNPKQLLEFQVVAFFYTVFLLCDAKSVTLAFVAFEYRYS